MIQYVKHGPGYVLVVHVVFAIVWVTENRNPNCVASRVKCELLKDPEQSVEADGMEDKECSTTDGQRTYADVAKVR